MRTLCEQSVIKSITIIVRTSLNVCMPCNFKDGKSLSVPCIAFVSSSACMRRQDRLPPTSSCCIPTRLDRARLARCGFYHNADSSVDITPKMALLYQTCRKREWRRFWCLDHSKDLCSSPPRNTLENSPIRITTRPSSLLLATLQGESQRTKTMLFRDRESSRRAIADAPRARCRETTS